MHGRPLPGGDLQRGQGLVVVKAEQPVAFPGEVVGPGRVGGRGPGYPQPFLLQFHDRGQQSLQLFTAYHPSIPGVRVKGAERDERAFPPERFEGRIEEAGFSLYEFLREPRGQPLERDMFRDQGRVHPAAGEKHEGFAFFEEAEEVGVGRRRSPGQGPGLFRDGRRNERVEKTGPDKLYRQEDGLQGGPAAGGRRARPGEVEARGVHGQQRAQGRGPAGPLKGSRVARDERAAGPPHGGAFQRFYRYFRAYPQRVPGGDEYEGFQVIVPIATEGRPPSVALRRFTAVISSRR